MNIDYDKIVSSQDTYVTNGKSYSSNDWYVTIRLSDFMNSREESIELDNGEEELGIFIPYKHNGISRTTRNNVLCTFKATMAERATNRYTHILRPVMDAVDYQYRENLGFKIPMMGHMRPTNYKTK